MHSIDDFLEGAQSWLLQARERGETFNFSPEWIRRVEALKRAIGVVRMEAILEAAAQAKPPARAQDVLHLV